MSSLNKQTKAKDLEVVDYLRQLPIEHLVAVLRQVFDARQPVGATKVDRERFFLGTASSGLVSQEGEPERWGPWHIEAVAYPDPAHYGQQLGPDYGLAQEGSCASCQITVRSNVKNALCPICGAKVHLT